MDAHQHRYNPATDLCEVEGCERQRPAWLDDDALAASSAYQGTQGPSGAAPQKVKWTAKMGPSKYALVVLVTLVATNLGARAIGGQIAEETNPDDNSHIPVNVDVK